jgi:nucleotide-binding universal stress UspA family protein
MRVLVWVTETGWEACVDAVRELGARGVTLLYAPSEETVEASRGALAGLLGRHRRPDLEERLAGVAAEAGEALLQAAAERLGRDARRVLASGKVERVVTEAARDADLLVAARSGHHVGPRSIRHPERFVVDHAPCPLLLVWPTGGPEGEPPPPPRHPPPGPH